MEYITDGTFQEALYQNWFTVHPVERLTADGAVEPDEKFFVRFGGGGRLGQSFEVSRPTPGTLRFSAGVKVSGGDGKPNGNVQLVLTSQTGSDPVKYYTFLIYEYGTWQTAEMVLQVDPTVERMGVMLLVIQGFDQEVSMRKVSFTDVDPADTAATTKGAEKQCEGPLRPDELPADFEAFVKVRV